MKTQAINKLAAQGSGLWRRPYVIREHLAGLGMSMADVAREIQVSGELVRATVRGQANNKKVLTKLLELNVPAEALSLPDAFSEQ